MHVWLPITQGGVELSPHSCTRSSSTFRRSHYRPAEPGSLARVPELSVPESGPALPPVAAEADMTASPAGVPPSVGRTQTPFTSLVP